MIERLQSSADKRRELEAKYSNLIPHMKIWADYPEGVYDNEVRRRYEESAAIVTEVMERDWKTYYIAYCLAIPLDQRLCWASERDKKYPRHPVTHNQIARALKGIEKELSGLALDWEFDLSESSPGIVMTLDGEGNRSMTATEGKKIKPKPARSKKFEQLMQRGLNLLQQLPENKREGYLL